MLSEREGTLATSLEGSGPQVLARSLLQPLPEWIPTDDLCIKDDDLADEFIMALQRVLPEKRLHHQVMVDDSDTEIEGRPPPEASHARNAVKWRRLARRRGVRKPRSVTLHPGRVRTRTAGDVTDTESMPPHARRGKKKAFDPTAAFGYPIAKRDRIPAAVHYQVMDFV
ncbi:hypothetical protein Pmar_PMAR016463 [Perkinsus marinus ATCC 50983]|uniref:Uncharacterized protein n=1 Tax=Perkinsus marinus (strain ATCC 50983 / TXsc) TaxID=423536 RepID=C5L1C4_PERM5|nr:hypothetical protein Pmar_PMAR016463 [Perkinsus marinus ATCC 50983]EER09531.1 hypothetical protein Pmar_PMAR016463 [Perkinsus marinus ATCC 50983]|eukprot:XP_002777715.1 hypothetical protein Pmar_PMAR016463 [Perkinsus marinus ATCC 50983]